MAMIYTAGNKLGFGSRWNVDQNFQPLADIVKIFSSEESYDFLKSVLPTINRKDVVLILGYANFLYRIYVNILYKSSFLHKYQAH